MRKAMSKPAKAKETCAHENRETTIGGGMRCKDCGAVVRGKAAPSPAEPIHVAGTRPDLLCCTPSTAERCDECAGQCPSCGYDIDGARAALAKAEEENERLATWGAAEQGAHLSWKASSHAAEACVKELLKIIEDAPHGGNCAGFPPHALSEASGTQRPATARKSPPR